MKRIFVFIHILLIGFNLSHLGIFIFRLLKGTPTQYPSRKMMLLLLIGMAAALLIWWITAILRAVRGTSLKDWPDLGLALQLFINGAIALTIFTMVYFPTGFFLLYALMDAGTRMLDNF